MLPVCDKFLEHLRCVTRAHNGKRNNDIRLEGNSSNENLNPNTFNISTKTCTLFSGNKRSHWTEWEGKKKKRENKGASFSNDSLKINCIFIWTSAEWSNEGKKFTTCFLRVSADLVAPLVSISTIKLRYFVLFSTGYRLHNTFGGLHCDKSFDRKGESYVFLAFVPEWIGR